MDCENFVKFGMVCTNARLEAAILEAQQVENGTSGIMYQLEFEEQ